MLTVKRLAVGFVSAAVVAYFGAPVSTAPRRASTSKHRTERVSAMGRAAARARARIEAAAHGVSKDFEEAGVCVNEPECEGDGEHEGLPDGPSSTQSETSIAVDTTGQHIVIGFNDTRGFSNESRSRSRASCTRKTAASTFVDGGQLPSPGNDVDRHHAAPAGVRRP